MRGRSADAAGFSLVEVVIAMVILGLIAVALIPVLWQGIMLSSQQSTVATATRQLNALVEQARDGGSCASVIAAAGVQTYQDGAGRDFTTAGVPGECTPCPSTVGTTISLELIDVMG
jgi:prepilin-type N-terminal cleavage/methylation domain-containing protein